MATVINVTKRNLYIARKQLRERELVEVNKSESELKKHPFVKAGWVEVAGAVSAGNGGSNKPSAAEVISQVAEMDNLDDLNALIESDSRKTVKEAVEARIDELLEDDGSEDGDNPPAE